MSQKNKMNVLDVRQRLLSLKQRIKSDRDFDNILRTNDMVWLKANSPEICADVILSLYEKIPEKDKFHTGYYLLDGNFARLLSNMYPYKYAEFFTKIVGFMEPKQSEFLSLTMQVPESSTCWVVFPKNLARLPAIILVKEGTAIKPYPVNDDLKKYIPADTLKAGLNLIAAHRDSCILNLLNGGSARASLLEQRFLNCLPQQLKIQRFFKIGIRV